MIGYKVVTASDGKEALKLFKDYEPDLVVLDVMMPKLDGYGVCQELRKDSDVPIVMLTALGDVADRITGLELGASKSNHATVLKYIAGEVQKCSLGDSEAMKDSTGTHKLNCDNKKKTGFIDQGAADALNTFKNPYGSVGTSALAVFKAAPFAAKANCTTDTEGRTNVEHKTTIVKISTCIAAGEDPLNDQLTVE